eukprot:UN2037
MPPRGLVFAIPGDKVGFTFRGLAKNTLPRWGGGLFSKRAPLLARIWGFDPQFRFRVFPKEIRLGFSPLGFFGGGPWPSPFLKLKGKMAKGPGAKKRGAPPSLNSKGRAQGGFPPPPPLVWASFKIWGGFSRGAFWGGKGFVFFAKFFSWGGKEGVAPGAKKKWGGQGGVFPAGSGV